MRHIAPRSVDVLALLALALLASAAGCQLAPRRREPTPIERGGVAVGLPSGPRSDLPSADQASLRAASFRPQLAYADRPSVAVPPTAAVPTALPPAFGEYAIDLPTALGLAGAENPTIALAGEAVRASRAELLEAQALLLPTLHAGLDFNLHRGPLQNAGGAIVPVNRESLYAGSGAGAVGAGTVAVPGVRVVAHLADALFEPRAARQRMAGRVFEERAARNAVLLEAAVHYFSLAGAENSLRLLRQTEAEFRGVADLTASFNRAGQGRAGDAERARGDALLLQTEVARAEEDVAVAAANLSRLLSMDPSFRLRAPDETVSLVRLIDPTTPLQQLLETALANRPEAGAAAALVAFHRTRLRAEKARPFVPALSAGFSAGDFGGGSDRTAPRFGRFGGRTDFDAAAVWTLQNFGLGNAVIQRQRRAELRAAEAEQTTAVDRIRREVAEAHAAARAAEREVEIARQRVEAAQQAYRLDLIRARNLEGHPIELLNSLNLLSVARQDWVRARVGYDQAQFRLYVGLGQPPECAPWMDATFP